jgi:hypothetical protein
MTSPLIDANAGTRLDLPTMYDPTVDIEDLNLRTSGLFPRSPLEEELNLRASSGYSTHGESRPITIFPVASSHGLTTAASLPPPPESPSRKGKDRNPEPRAAGTWMNAAVGSPGIASDSVCRQRRFHG